MSNSLQRLVFGGKDVRFTDNGFTTFDPSVTPLGFWLFNKAPGETDAEAAIRCSKNRIIGSRNYPEDRVVIGTPTFNTDYANFPATAAIRTNISEPTDWTMYIVARSTDTGLGSVSTARAHMAGWFGNAANKGSSLVFNTTTVVRGITYQNATTPTIATVDLSVPAGTVNKWRIYRLWGSSGSFRPKNISGDSTTNEPSATTLPDTRIQGLQKFSIGARLESGQPSALYTGQCDIAAVLLLNGTVGSGATETLIANQLKSQIGLMGITELSV